MQLSQELFYENGTLYDQLLILNDDFEVDPTLLAEQGLPFYAGSYIQFFLDSWMLTSDTVKGHGLSSSL